MLFDLQGPRKTFVKAIYLGLAILMAGGLVLFGIGSDVNGGLADIFSGGSTQKDQVEEAQKAVQKNPESKTALQDLIAARYALAGTEENYNQEENTFSKEGKEQLQAAKKNWQAYLKLSKDKPDPVTAQYAASVFLGLQDAKGAAAAQEFVARDEPNSANYLALMLYALYAGDQLAATGAEVQARELAKNKDELKDVEAEIKRAKKQVATQNQQIQKQIQEQFEAQNKQSQGGGIPGNPFSGAGAAPQPAN